MIFILKCQPLVSLFRLRGFGKVLRAITVAGGFVAVVNDASGWSRNLVVGATERPLSLHPKAATSERLPSRIDPTVTRFCVDVI
jgi:hypothetical protein